MREAGNVPAIDAARRIVAYESARLEVAELELELADRREALHRLLGAHGDATGWTAAGALEAPPVEVPVPDEVERRAIEASLDLAASRAALDGMARRNGLARTEGWMPEIELDVHVLEGEPETPTGGASELRVGAGASVSVPLFDRRQGTVRARVAAFDALMERHHGIAIDVRSGARRLANHVRSQHARARHLSDVVVPAARAVLEQSVLQYDAMQIGIFELLAARRELLAIEVAEVLARRDYWTAVAALHALLTGKLVHREVQAASPRMDGSGGEAEGGH
jgi:outer membrane protein TolC